MPCTNPPIIVDPRNPAGKKLRCQPGLVCTILPGLGPGGTAVCLPPGPSGPSGSAPGEGQRCLLPNQFPGSGLRGNCQSGLVCKTSGDLGVPICMKPTKSGMGSKEILTIIGLIFLGLCFLCGLAKMGMKDAKRKGNCDKACGAFVFLGVALIAVSSVMKSSN